jgi:hypothetical protein
MDTAAHRSLQGFTAFFHATDSFGMLFLAGQKT